MNRNRNAELRALSTEIQESCPELSSLLQLLAGIYLFPDIEYLTESDGTIILDGAAEHINMNMRHGKEAFSLVQQAKILSESCSSIPLALQTLIDEAYSDLRKKPAHGILLELMILADANEIVRTYLHTHLHILEFSLSYRLHLLSDINEQQLDELTRPEWIAYYKEELTGQKSHQSLQAVLLQTVQTIMGK